LFEREKERKRERERKKEKERKREKESSQEEWSKVLISSSGSKKVFAGN